MMKPTMLNVIGMVEHVVTTKMMDGIALAQNANVLVSSKFLGCRAILVPTQAQKKRNFHFFQTCYSQFELKLLKTRL